MKKILIDFDDLHYRHPENCLQTVDYLVERNPDIKLLFFTIPFLDRLEIGNDTKFCEDIKKYIDSGHIQLAIHGTYHSSEEFKNLDRENARMKISLSERLMREANLPFIRVFKGPHWGINKNTIDVLTDRDYDAIFSHEDYSHLETPDIDFCYYNWNLKDDYVSTEDKIVIAHGHTHSVCGNGIRQIADKLLSTIERENLIPTHYDKRDTE
tara:strand:- start:147257 stop:147889 length:633 start_codon:yes stop_codon:yes gene_type:complete